VLLHGGDDSAGLAIFWCRVFSTGFRVFPSLCEFFAAFLIKFFKNLPSTGNATMLGMRVAEGFSSVAMRLLTDAGALEVCC
jgi:hypothetical protein